MSMELRRPPMGVFHMPGLHPGLHYLAPRPGWVIRPATGAAVRLFGESDEDDLRAAQQVAIDRQQQRLLGSVMEIATVPVLLENAVFRNSFAMIDGRIWLNGAAGTRMRKKFDQQNPEDWRQDRLRQAFRRARRDARVPLPVWKEDVSDLPVAIELKNGFNYFHFSTETLGCLAQLASDAGDQPINLHLPHDNVRGFVEGFIQALFPELASRVQFVSAARSYDRVRSLYNHRHYLYQVEDPRIAKALAGPGVDPRWATALRHDQSSRKSVVMASFDSSLRLLRDHALRQLPHKAGEGLPRLIWMGRDEGGEARARGLTGHGDLLAALKARGFEQVAFEHLPPLQQIAQMQAADIVVAPHGAGLANMIYARRDALVIEIGTRQTQLHRWGDFLPCAHVAHCRYDTVFADIAGIPAAAEVPPITEGLLGIHIGRQATRRILTLVDEALDQGVRAYSAAG